MNSKPLKWSTISGNEICFPFSSFEALINDLGWEFEDWLEYYSSINGEELAYRSWAEGTKRDWIWGLGLPLLSEIRRCISSSNERKIIGISALPGCGKTSLGNWLEASAKEIDIPINVISLDDFYYKGDLLDKAMSGNPWEVPRALPGSHEIKLLEETIYNWLETGKLVAPKFDKSLRHGLGDRSGWIRSNPKALVIEGWFLGCRPLEKFKPSQNELNLNLSTEEINYREIVQSKLNDYIHIWNLFNRVWHIKAIDFSATCKWKTYQENKMFEERGSSLRDESLKSFVRMIEVALPQESLNNLACDVIIKINQSRKVIWAGLS